MSIFYYNFQAEDGKTWPVTKLVGHADYVQIASLKGHRFICERLAIQRMSSYLP